MRGRVDVEPDDIADLAANCGSRLSLKLLSRCGARPWARQIFCTVLIASPMAPAIARLVQCVVSPSGSPSVRSINRATTGSGPRLAGLAGLVAQQPVNPRFHEAALPAPYAGLGQAGPAHHLG